MGAQKTTGTLPAVRQESLDRGMRRRFGSGRRSNPLNRPCWNWTRRCSRRSRSPLQADPDSRSMPPGKGHGTDVAYNVQVTVDSKHKLILDHEVTNAPTDRGHLSPMAIRARDLLGVKRLEAVADMGYYDGQEVKSCAQAGIKTYMPKPITSASRCLGLFTNEDVQ